MSEESLLGSATDFLRKRTSNFAPRVAMVLGSGLGAIADSVSVEDVIAFAEIPGFPSATVMGHSGNLVVGGLEEVPVILQSGRFHLYEGFDPATVVLPTRLFAELGVEAVIVTNAAGGLNPVFRPPTLMLIADHINYMWRNPLIGPVMGGEHRWPDLYFLYDQDLRACARRVALEHGVALQEGVYAGVLGPNYETPAEIRMLRRLGADAVGMSTVPEVIAARARGLRVLGISSITNAGAGLRVATLSHSEVLIAGATLAAELEILIRGVLRHLAG
jgi:purine-nucleoside phosphorylase